MIRGGSYFNTAENARSAYRNNRDASDRNDDIGFRPASPSHRQIDGVARLASTMPPPYP